jgi:hypothetical protein
MRKILLATSALCLVSAGARAQATGCAAPPQAVAAGYTTPVLTDNFTGNTVQPPGTSGGVYNWYPVDGLTNYSVSSNGLTINTDNSGFGAGLTTYPGNGTSAALSTPDSLAVNTGNGVVYQYGYFQATFSFNPNGYTGSGDWPAFWLGHATDGPSNANGNMTEIDAFEGIPGWPPKAGVPANNTSTVLEWTQNNGQMLAQGAFNVSQNVNFNQPNTIGALWTPTSISIYLNNVLQSTIPIGPGTQFPSAAIDYANLILGTGYNWPVTFKSVDVWQSGRLPGSASGGAGSSAATPCQTSSTVATAPSPVTATASNNPTTAHPATAAVANSVSSASTPASTPAAQITPGQGSITDAQGNVWKISADGSVEENGNWIPGGGGTAALTIGADGTVYGQDSGHGPVNPGGWFTLNGDGQYWTPSPPPAGADVAATPKSAGGGAAPILGAPACVNGTAISGSFSVSNGEIIGPDGKVFIANGINIGPQNMADVQQNLLTMFPGTNFIRLATWDTAPYSTADYQAFVSWATQHGIVVQIEDHAYPSPGAYTGAQLQQESAWYASLAATFKTNPYVWFGTMNEPSGNFSDLVAQEVATYNAIRGTGSSAMLMLEEFGGGNPGTIGAGAGMDPSAFANMTNVAWDLHYYGWASGMSQDPATVTADLLGSTSGHYGIGAAQTITSKDGTVPVIVGEFGDSTSGGSVDANGTQVVNAVLNSGYGYAAWTWGGSGGPDQLTQGGALTGFGQQVATAIKQGSQVSQTPCGSSVTMPATSAAGSVVPQNTLANITMPTILSGSRN